MQTKTVKKGNHYSGLSIHPILNPTGIQFDCMFTKNSEYPSIPNTALNEQWNKLGGLSFDPIGWNSARVGWRYNSLNEQFQIVAYYHINGKFFWREKSIRKIERDMPFTVKIHRYTKFCIDAIYVEIFIDGERDTLDHIDTPFKYTFIGYEQNLHFGGKITAPYDIEVEIGNKSLLVG